MKKTLIILSILNSAAAFAAGNYHCETKSDSEWVSDMKTMEIAFATDGVKAIAVDRNVFLSLNRKYKPTSANAGYKQYRNPRIRRFDSVMLSPEIIAGRKSGVMKLGIEVDSYHGQIAYFSYQCKKIKL